MGCAPLLLIQTATKRGMATHSVLPHPPIPPAGGHPARGSASGGLDSPRPLEGGLCPENCLAEPKAYPGPDPDPDPEPEQACRAGEALPRTWLQVSVLTVDSGVCVVCVCVWCMCVVWACVWSLVVCVCGVCGVWCSCVMCMCCSWCVCAICVCVLYVCWVCVVCGVCLVA